MSSNLKVKKNCQPQVPLKTQKRMMLPIKSSIAPGYYTSKAGKPGIFKTATGSVSWKYSTLHTASIRKAEGIAMAGVEFVGHPRLKAWEPTDVEKLLPAKHKISEGKLSNFVMDYLFLLIENQSQGSKDNASTVNSDVYNNMTHFSMKTFLKRKYDFCIRIFQHQT